MRAVTFLPAATMNTPPIYSNLLLLRAFVICSVALFMLMTLAPHA